MDIETLALAKGYTNKQIKKLSVNGIKGDKGDPGKDAVIDTTLSNSGEAADAKVVGNEISSLKDDIAAITPDDTTVDWKPWTSKKIVDTLCQPFEETGNPVQCYPVSGYPLGCKVIWEPVQEGEGDPSPDNIRPITGRDAVRLTRCGKNLIDTSRIELGTFDQSTGEPVAGIANQSRITYDIGCAAENQMVYSNFNTENGRAFFWNDNGYVGTLLLINGSAFTPITGSKYMRLVSASQGFVDSQLELGSTATTYTPYTGQTAILTLPRTIYGGTVDAVTGEGQETWKVLTLDNFDSNDYNEGDELAGWVQSDAAVAWFVYKPELFPNTQKIVANVFLTKQHIVTNVTPYSIGSGNGFIAFRLPRSVAATKDDVRNWLKEHNAQIAFEVKSPTPIVSTGAQPIPALSGVNTVLTDADSVTVTGRADPIKRITDLEDAVASMTNT